MRCVDAEGEMKHVEGTCTVQCSAVQHMRLHYSVCAESFLGGCVCTVCVVISLPPHPPPPPPATGKCPRRSWETAVGLPCVFPVSGCSDRLPKGEQLLTSPTNLSRVDYSSAKINLE